jgi:hypothetical protein
MHHGYAAQWGLSPVPTQYKPDSVDVLYTTMGDLEYHQCLLGYHRTIPSVNSLARTHVGINVQWDLPTY